jgi:hypothetical protein
MGRHPLRSPSAWILVQTGLRVSGPQTRAGDGPGPGSSGQISPRSTIPSLIATSHSDPRSSHLSALCLLLCCTSLLICSAESASVAPSFSTSLDLRKPKMAEEAAPSTPGGIPTAEFIVSSDTSRFHFNDSMDFMFEYVTKILNYVRIVSMPSFLRMD